MAEEKANVVTSRGPWTCVQKVRSKGRSFYVNVECHDKPPREAVELAGGVCAKARCLEKALCFRQVKFKDGHRGYEFSCTKHREKI